MLTGEGKSRSEEGGTRWLSGAIVTPLNMFVFPIIWYGLVLVVVVYYTAKTGHLPDLRKLGFYGVWLLAVTVFVGWVSSRTRRVGIEPGRLVVSSYFREIRVPFRQIEAVESVWWNWRRLVRVRFTGPGGYSEAIYYIPPWAGLRFLYRDPVEELRRLITQDRLATYGHE